MDRRAVFVDAGFVLAEAVARLGLPGRAALECDYEALIQTIIAMIPVSRERPKELLRLYWYDGAPDGFPTPVHREIARLTNVKLRLGRLVHGRQKGVDALIILDLMKLAREKAIVEACLITGDEDIREGVLEAQDMGVRAHLYGIEPKEKYGNTADTLVQAVDEYTVIPWSTISSAFKAVPQRRLPLQATAVDESHAPTETAKTEQVDAHGAAENAGSQTASSDAAAEAESSSEQSPEEIAILSAEQWFKKVNSREQAEKLVQLSGAFISSDADRALLIRASAIRGGMWDDHRTKIAMRKAFKKRIKELLEGESEE